MSQSVIEDQLVEWDTESFRDVLRNLPVPVGILTTADGTQRDGLTISSFNSVSLNPPLVSVSLTRNKPATDLTLQTGRFAINFLASDSVALANHFAQSRGVPKFESVEAEDGPGGLPTLAEAVAVLYARVRDVHEAGDHYLITGEVFAGRVNGGV